MARRTGTVSGHPVEHQVHGESRSGDYHPQRETAQFGSAEEHLFAESERRQPSDSEYGALEVGGQETLYQDASDPQPTDSGRGSDVQPREGHRREVQVRLQQSSVQQCRTGRPSAGSARPRS